MNLGKILCADFGEFSGKVLAKKLKSMNFLVDYANNGKDALDLGLLHDYDLVFISLELPIVSGYDVARELRLSDLNLPLIVYTSYSKEKVNMDFFTDYLHKPFKNSDLDAVVGKYL